MYVRASIIEQLPDPLSPLFADLIDGAVIRSMTNLLTEFLGRNVLRDGDLGGTHDQRLCVLLLQPGRDGPNNVAHPKGHEDSSTTRRVQREAAMAELLPSALSGNRR
jgi:hypothetical protein